MSKSMKWVGFFATVVIIIVLQIYAWQEPGAQEEIRLGYHLASVVSATDLYAENCVICHGSLGEGIGGNPPLNTDGIRTLSSTDLSKIIARGRTDTTMAGWALDEGGVFSKTQVDDLVTLIQYGNWEFIQLRVAELGLTPPEVIAFEVSEDMLTSLTTLPDGEKLGEGLIVYAENCSACHAANGSGTQIAPGIDSPELRAVPREEMVQLINTGVPGTLMSNWQNMLSPEQIDLVVDLIYRWPELIQSEVEFPESELMSMPSSPEMIADGDRLYHIACKSCHGAEGYGTPMAPALNNQLFLSQTPDAAIYQIIAGGVSETLMPGWGFRLTDYDLQSLVAYLRSLEAFAPPIVPPIIGP